jgi:hypothetical protein
LMWVWINTYRYIFSGMNIHLPAILMFTRYQGFDPSPCEQKIQYRDVPFFWTPVKGERLICGSWYFRRSSLFQRHVSTLPHYFIRTLSRFFFLPRGSYCCFGLTEPTMCEILRPQRPEPLDVYRNRKAVAFQGAMTSKGLSTSSGMSRDVKGP